MKTQNNPLNCILKIDEVYGILEEFYLNKAVLKQYDGKIKESSKDKNRMSFCHPNQLVDKDTPFSITEMPTPGPPEGTRTYEVD